LRALLTPRGTLLPPIVGDISQESAALAPFFTKEPTPPEQPSATSAPAPRWTPDWRQLLVGFGSGVVVAVIGAFQWQEWRRRRASPQAAGRSVGSDDRLARDRAEGPSQEGVFSPSEAKDEG
jgi:hypothetical protein